MSSSRERSHPVLLTPLEHEALRNLATSARESGIPIARALNAASRGLRYGTLNLRAPEESKKSPTTSQNSSRSEESLTASVSGTVRCFISISASGTVTGLSFESSEKNCDSEIRTQWQDVSAQHAHSLLASLIDED